MENRNINDSDIEIIEHEQTIVSIAESEDEEIMHNAQTSVFIIEDDDNEEGELVENEPQIADNLLFEVKFKNNIFFKKNGSIIAKALEKACEILNESIKCELTSEELTILAYKKNVNNNNNKAPQTNSKESSPDLTGIKELFTIDASPSEKPEPVEVPSYKRNIKNVLDEESLENKRQKIENACPRPRPSVECFNCGLSGHALRDCSKKRNMRRIQQARNKYMNCSEQRYHSQIEQQYPHLRPGLISENLRKALGIRSSELPFFYYRMRVLGYPPGWLEDAKVQPSGLALISADGSKDEQCDEKTENRCGEKYDVSKIIDFPGFNVRPAHKYYDDYKHHNVPPLQKNQLKEEFIKGLGENIVKGYKRRKISSLPQIDGKKCKKDEVICIEPTDMDIEDETEEDQHEENDLSKNRTNSPTLADLEAQQNAILQALENRNSTKNLNVCENIDESKIREENNIEFNNTLESSTPKQEVTTPIIKESHKGTPLLKFSPFEKLPSGDNFKVGVSDVINFENLPDSTGKYEQMKLVINKVRNIVTKLNSEDAD